MEVPKTKNNKVIQDTQGFPELVKDYGQYTCFHIAHWEARKGISTKKLKSA